jgi:hypothetical protein
MASGRSGAGGGGGHVSAGQIAALVAAGAFVVLVALLAVPLLKLGRTLDEATVAIRKAHEGSAGARTVSTNVSVLTSLVTATLGGPLVRAAALSYGLSKAVKARREGKDAGAHSRRRGRRGRRR